MDERPDISPTRPRKSRGWVSALRRRMVRSDITNEVLAGTAAAYLRLVRATGRLIFDGDDLATVYARNAPLIGTIWHSEAFLLPVLLPPGAQFDVMVSRAGDGEIISRTLRRFGIGAVRGSGATDPTRMFEKGSVSAFRGLKASLDAGRSVVLTADFDARTHAKVSPGVIALARLAQRPIIPSVIVTSRRLRVRSWDRTAINLPFSRIVFAHGDPVMVPRRASAGELEDKRLEVERTLVAITDRAYAIAERRRG